MKILMVNKFLYPNGGSETYIFKLGECLKKLGHEVEYFGMEHEGRCVGNSANAYTSDMDFHGGSKLKKITYPIKTIYSKEARQKMNIVLNDFQPDVVHLNNFNFQLTPSIIYAVKDYKKTSGKKVKLIYTAHDYQLVCPNHMMQNPNNHENCEACIGGKFINCTKGRCIHSSLAKSAIGTLEATIYKTNNVYKNIDKIICCSKFMEDKLLTNPIFKGKTVMLHNFIDKDTKNTANKKDYVLYFGRYSEEKGIDLLLEVAKMTPDIQYIFAGSGPMEDKIDNIGNIKNVGFKTGDELDTLIGEAKLSIYPSVWYENCPFSVMESISLNTPVVGANIGGIPELINDEETGLLFEPNNKYDLKDKIEKIYNGNFTFKNTSNFDTTKSYTEKLLDIYSCN